MIIFPTPCFSKELFHTRTILSSFPQWWNIMNVSHYVAVVHWANKLTDLMSVLLSFILISWNFLLLLKVWLNMDILSSPPPHPLKEWRWMWRGAKQCIPEGACIGKSDLGLLTLKHDHIFWVSIISLTIQTSTDLSLNHGSFFLILRQMTKLLSPGVGALGLNEYWVMGLVCYLN